MNHFHRLFLAAFAVIATLALSILPARAQTITNPSFEADTFTVSPGYISGNAPITGWTANDNARAGITLTPAPGPFVNNGAVPNGTKGAFIQSGVVGGTTLSTVITGLTPGQLYKVNFRCTARTNTSLVQSTANLKVSVDGTPIVDTTVTSVSTVVNTVAWKFFAFDFTAAAATATMTLKNDTAADTAAVVDNFSIAPSNGAWTIANWTSDATSGVDNTKNYTHAYEFGGAVQNPTINSIPFTGAAGSAPSAAGKFSTAGFNANTTDAGNVLITAGGGSANLANAFIYNGNPSTINIFGLVPGAEYVATVYSVGWDAAPITRPVTFSVGTDRLTVNQNHYGNDQGIRVSYRYIAPAQGYIAITYAPLINPSLTTFHTYGFSNYEVTNAPVVALQSRNAIGAIGNTNYFRATASGKPPLTYQWFKDGSPIGGNSPVLTVPVLSAADAGNYSVTVTNLFGTNASPSLSLTLGQIANPSFETDIFYGFPGYVGVSAPNPPGFQISGWTVNNTNRAGLNPTADGQIPFANNGVIPDGTQVAFVQSPNPGSCVLSTLIQGLTPAQTYTMQFRANARNGQRANMHIGIDNNSIVDIYESSVGGVQPYKFISFDFLAAGTSALLALTNDIAGDHTLLVDNFTIAPSTTKWSFSNWINDATAGIDTTKLYTHAFYFGGTTPDTNINGVVFRGAPGANPVVPGFLTMSGFGNVFTGDANVLTAAGGGSAGIASQFIYGGPVQVITLSGLQPGTEYVASIYAVAFDARAYGRSMTFNVGTDRMTINQDHFGNDQGIIVFYRYIADPSGSMVLTYTPTDAASTFHTYAVANRVANDSVPVIGVQPMNTFTAAGTTATLVAGLSAGSLPLYYQWYSNGVLLADQTNSTLVLSNLTVFGTNGFSVIITNFLGAATSSVAIVEVGTALTGLFHTGVDDASVYLPGGIVDSHYKMVFSADPAFPGPDAVTLHNGAFPLAGNYFTNGPYSSWIAPRTNSSIGNATGFYVFRTSFIIDTADAAHAQINGKWASDNEGIAIGLNGTSTGISNMVSAAFGAFTSFTIPGGFVPGTNVIDFVISNGPASGPTGLRAEMNGVGRPLTNARPQIVSQPASRAFPENGTAEFVVLGYGSGPLTYQWYFFGFELPGETNRVLRLPNVAVDQEGPYSVRIINDAGFTNSVDAILTVILPPIVIADPVSQTVQCSSNATFTVGVDGTPPYTYQWYFAGIPIPGATGATLTVSNAHTAQAGAYSVAVTNAAGGVVSGNGVLTVVDTIAPTITCPADVLVMVDVGLCTASGVNLSTPVTADGCGIASVSSNAPAVFPAGTTIVTWTVTDGGGNSSTCMQRVTVIDRVPPVITAEPQNQTNTVGTTAMFSVAVASCVPPTFQWCRGTNLIVDATNATLSIPNVQDASGGDYLVKISNAAGSVTSVVAVLTINHPPVAGDNGVATTQGQATGLPFHKLLINDSDPDGDTLTVTAVSATSTNGGAVTLTSSNVIYTPLPAFTGTDRFTYTASDGRGGSATGQVEVLVVSGSLPSANLASLEILPGGVRVRFAGIPGHNYQIERAVAVTGPWTTLTTQTAPLHGIIEYLDTTPPPGAAFYRTVAP